MNFEKMHGSRSVMVKCIEKGYKIMIEILKLNFSMRERGWKLRTSNTNLIIVFFYRIGKKRVIESRKKANKCKIIKLFHRSVFA